VLDKSMQFAGDAVAYRGGHSLRFERYVEPGLALEGSAAAWERVFVNLFLNAAQAMPEGGCVRVRAVRESGAIAVDVTDQGPGIAPEILEDIFRPGFSTKNSRSGLGLHIVETIVRQHGGTIAAGNNPAGGATFRIRIPALQSSKVTHACA
jgi:signal transduction histidine kinase